MTNKTKGLNTSYYHHIVICRKLFLTYTTDLSQWKGQIVFDHAQELLDNFVAVCKHATYFSM